MRKDDACWVLGHGEWMTERGKHFCRLKFCGWKTTYFGLLSMMWKDKPNATGYTHAHTKSHSLAIVVGPLRRPPHTLTQTDFPTSPPAFQVFPLKIPKSDFPSSKNTHTHTCKHNKTRHKKSIQMSNTNENVEGSSTYEYAYTNTYRNKTNTHTCFMDLT